MSLMNGNELLQAAAERIVARYLAQTGKLDVVRTGGREALGGKNVDITYSWQGGRRKVKVKADPYVGTDPAKISNRELPFYRSDAGIYAFEAVANSATREPGWVFNTEADELYYYYLAIAQTEDEVRALFAEPDEVFFAELRVDLDNLHVLPLHETRAWFEEHFENYTPRPVMQGGFAAWYRLVPRSDIVGDVPGIRGVGPIFPAVSR